MKKLLTMALAACACGLTISSAFAGPLILGPSVVPIPKIMVAPVKTVTSTPVRVNVLNSYRQIRAFWLSRALVR